MKRSLYVSGLAAVFLGFSLVPSATSPAVAQSISGSQRPAEGALFGVVRDSSSAVIPRPTIVVRQDPSGLEHVIDGTADGSFSVSRLAPGRYIVTASAPGFAVSTEVVEAPRAESLILTLAPAPIVEHVTVVSASRQEELRDTLNTRVDVITRSRIEETGGQETVGEILRELPGVVTRRGSETAGAAGEQIQGIDSRQVLVLLDGQPIVGARGIKRGGILNLDRQSTARLECVEVVKGAASTLYGSEAIGGVINLITREPLAPFDVNVAVSGLGNLGVMGTRLDTGFKREKSFGVFSAERHQHDGFDLTPGTFDTTGAPYRRYDLLAKLQRQFTPSFALTGVVTGYQNTTGGRSNGELGPQEDDIRDHALSVNVAGHWLAGANTTVEARGYVSTFSEDSEGRLAPRALHHWRRAISTSSFGSST